jgi:hypothetical protein
MNTCSTCQFWSTDAISQIIGFKPSTERICRRSLDLSFPASGQDGRAIITYENFGCIFHKEKVAPSETSDTNNK